MGAITAVQVEEREGAAEDWRNPMVSLPPPSALKAGSYGGGERMSPAVSSPADSISGPRRTSGPVRRASGGWTPEEDENLRKAVDAFKGRQWKKIAEFIPDRTEVQCMHRWQKVLNPELVKGSWTQEEDDIIINMVKKHGPKKWSMIARSLGGRIGKQCRERWHNHLDPQIRKEAWTVEEERLIANAHHVYGNKWAEIAKLLPGRCAWGASRISANGNLASILGEGTEIVDKNSEIHCFRTDNSIKNHWNGSLKKRLDNYKTSSNLPVSIHNVHNCLEHSKQPAALNHIDLNKDPNIHLRDPPEIVGHSERTSHLHACNSKDIKSCSEFVSLSMPTAQPEIPCGALTAEDSAVALVMQGLKLEAVDAGCGTDKTVYSGSSKSGDKTGSNLCDLSLMNESSSSLGSCYQIPTLDDIIPAHSPVFSRHHVQNNCGDGFQSPTGYSTSSPMDGNVSNQLSVESILKSSDENFPGSPSILRRRKREKPLDVQESNLKIDILNGDSFHTPLGKCTSVSPQSLETATFLSLAPPDGEGLSAALGSVDVSPAYRLRSKKMAVLKSIERHIDFSSDGMDNCNTPDILKATSWDTVCTNSSTDVSSLPEKNMREHIGLDWPTLAKDFAHTTKLDWI